MCAHACQLIVKLATCCFAALFFTVALISFNFVDRAILTLSLRVVILKSRRHVACLPVALHARLQQISEKDHRWTSQPAARLDRSRRTRRLLSIQDNSLVQ